MPEIFKISKEAADQLFLKYQPPAGFRFAASADFVKDGKRIDQLTIFILNGGNELIEYWFNYSSKRDYIQWLLYNHRIFIKVPFAYAENEINQVNRNFTYLLEPSAEFLIEELEKFKN